ARYRQRLAFALVGDHAIALVYRALQFDAIPARRVTDVRDRDVIVGAPEKRSGTKRFPRSEQVARSRLTLPLGNHPMLDTDRFAAPCIWPARDVAGGEDVGRARFEQLVHYDAAIHRQSGRLGD